MKVHLFTSRLSLKNDTNIVDSILEAINQSGNDLAYNWINNAYSPKDGFGGSPDAWRKICRRNIEDIAKSDVVIAESSYNSFAIGYQVACAIHQKKPTLILRKDSVPDDIFAVGVIDSWVVHKKYKDNEELKQIVLDFLKENDIQSKDMRFNFFIDRKIYNYLRWASVKTGKTKAEILRQLVEREIDRDS